MTARAGSAPLAAVIVTDAPDLAGVLGAVVGLTPRQLRELVRERGIRHTTWRRHVYVRVEDVVQAMGLGAAESPAVVTDPAWDEGRVIQMAARGRK